MITILLTIALLSFGAVGVALFLRALRIAKGKHSLEGASEGPDMFAWGQKWLRAHLALVVPGMVHTREAVSSHAQRGFVRAKGIAKRVMLHPDMARKVEEGVIVK